MLMKSFTSAYLFKQLVRVFRIHIPNLHIFLIVDSCELVRLFHQIQNILVRFDDLIGEPLYLESRALL